MKRARYLLLMPIVLLVGVALFCFFNTQKPQSVPQKLSIESLEYNEETRMVSWDKCVGATRYILRIGEDEVDQSLIVEKNGKMQYELQGLKGGSYAVFVIAAGNEKTYLTSIEAGILCAVILRLNALEINTNSDGLTWTPVENAGGYTIIYGDGQAVQLDKNVTSWNFPKEEPAGNYEINMLAVGDEFNLDSPVASLTFSHKTLIAPKNPQINDNFSEICWEKVEKAEYYDIYLDGKLLVSGLTATNITLEELDAGEYEVEIVPRRAGYIGLGTFFSFIKDTLKTPGNIICTYDENHNLVITWDKISHANSYEITLGKTMRLSFATTSVIVTRDLVLMAENSGEITISATDTSGKYKKSNPAKLNFRRIEYEAAGGSVFSPVICVYNVPFILGKAVRHGYVFKGWAGGITSFTITDENDGDEIKFFAEFYPIFSLEKNIMEAGEISFTQGQNGEVYILATTNTGYTWLGWFCGEKKLTDETSYTFTPQTEGEIFTATWGDYSVVVSATEGGAVTGGGRFRAGTEVTISAQTAEHYTFLGWFESGKRVSGDLAFTFSMPYESVSYQARWVKSVTVSINVTKNIPRAGEISALPNEIFKGQEITLTAATNIGYAWVGWFSDEELLSLGAVYTFTATADMDIEARWQASGTIIVTLEKNIDEAGEVSQFYEGFGDETTIFATTKGNYTWLGWYDGDKKLTDKMTYTFKPGQSVTLTARWGDYNVFLSVTEGGTVSGDGRYIAGTSVTITTQTTENYTFLGWFESNNKISDDLIYIFIMPFENVNYQARWEKLALTEAVTITKNIDAAGEISTLPDEIYVGQKITVTAITNVGYTWLGWFSGEERLTTSLNYIITVTSNPTVYTARWGDYNVIVSAAEGGTVIGGGRFVAEQEVTLTASTITGYTWLGWFDGDKKVSGDLTYTFFMPYASLNLTAKWGNYSVILSATEGGTVTGGGRFESGTEVTISAATDIDYIWLGWFNGEELVSGDTVYTFVMPYESVKYQARWSKPQLPAVTITLTKNIIEAGEISGGGERFIGQEINLIATTNEGYTFLGWFDGENMLSLETIYTFTATIDRQIEARWKMTDTVVITLTKNISAAGDVSGGGRFLIGQTVTAVATINSGYDWLGWYIGGVIQSVSLSYTFTVAADMTIQATWKIAAATTATIIITRNIEGAGTISGGGSVEIGELITITASTNSGYIWLGWHENDTLVTMNEIHAFVVQADRAIQARWEAAPVLIEYTDDNGEKQTAPSGIITLTAGANMTMRGWYLLLGTVSGGYNLTVSGEVNLILSDGSDWQSSGNIIIAGGGVLRLYGQSTGENRGALKATGDIRGENESRIEINGGTLAAKNISGFSFIAVNNGTVNTANISGKSITINGGAVNADNISGDLIVLSGGTITASFIGESQNEVKINGGFVTAENITGRLITVRGGTITVTNMGGRNGGLSANGENGSEIIISGGKVVATNIGGGNGGEGKGGIEGTNGGKGGDGGKIYISGGTVSATNIGGGNGGAGGTGSTRTGSGGDGGKSGEIILSGGSVTAGNIGGGRGGNSGVQTLEYGYVTNAQIGGGGNGGSGETITLSGGEIEAQHIGGGHGGSGVNAYSSNIAPAGRGGEGSVLISGATVITTSIGGGNGGNGGGNGGKSFFGNGANGGSGGNGKITVSSGSLTATYVGGGNGGDGGYNDNTGCVAGDGGTGGYGQVLARGGVIRADFVSGGAGGNGGENTANRAGGNGGNGGNISVVISGGALHATIVGGSGGNGGASDYNYGKSGKNGSRVE